MADEGGPTGISVVGTGRVAVEPEIATLDVGVSLEGVGLDSVHQAAAAKLTAARDHLLSAGVSEHDISTTTLNVRSSRDRQSGRQVFYVSARLTAVIRMLSTAEVIVNEFFEKVGDGLEMNGLTFDVEDRTDGHQQALMLAFDDARAKGATLANHAGLRLGDVLAMVEGTAGQPPMSSVGRSMLTAAGPESIPIEAGDLVISVSVEVRFALARG